MVFSLIFKSLLILNCKYFELDSLFFFQFYSAAGDPVYYFVLCGLTEFASKQMSFLEPLSSFDQSVVSRFEMG